MTNPGRCDLCHRHLVIGEENFVYFTPSTATEAEAEAGEGFWAEDPEWAVCLDCHRRLQMHHAGLMSEDAWVAVQLELALNNQVLPMLGIALQDMKLARILAAGARDHAEQTLWSFLRNKGPDYVSEINEGVE